MRETVDRNQARLAGALALAGSLALVALAPTAGCTGDVAELEAETKELRAELREVREELRSIRTENRELREKVDGLSKTGTTDGAGSTPVEAGDDAGAVTVASDAGSTAPPPNQANVKIGIESNPRGATVYLDDKVLGRTPLLYEHEPGNVQLLLRIEKPGYRPRLLSIRPEEDAKISVQLAKQ